MNCFCFKKLKRLRCSFKGLRVNSTAENKGFISLQSEGYLYKSNFVLWYREIHIIFWTILWTVQNETCLLINFMLQTFDLQHTYNEYESKELKGKYMLCNYFEHFWLVLDVFTYNSIKNAYLGLKYCRKLIGSYKPWLIIILTTRLNVRVGSLFYWKITYTNLWMENFCTPEFLCISIYRYRITFAYIIERLVIFNAFITK